MSLDKMTVDEMSADKMPIDEMSVDEMSVDEMTCCRKYYNFIFPPLFFGFTFSWETFSALTSFLSISLQKK